MVIKNLTPATSKEKFNAQMVAKKQGFKETFQGINDVNRGLKCGDTYVVFHEVGGEVLPIKMVNQTYKDEEGQVQGHFQAEGFDRNGCYVNGRIGICHIPTEDNPYSDVHYSANCIVVDKEDKVSHVTGVYPEYIDTDEQGRTIVGPMQGMGRYNPAAILTDFNIALADLKNLEDILNPVIDNAEEQ